MRGVVVETMTVLGVERFCGDGRSAGRARRFVRAMLGADHPCMEDAELCTSELVANAVAHTASGRGGHLTVTVATEGDVVQISVDDEGADGAVPHVEAAIGEETLAEGGRGVLIVATLAIAWGAETGASGTTTWFRLTE